MIGWIFPKISYMIFQEIFGFEIFWIFPEIFGFFWIFLDNRSLRMNQKFRKIQKSPKKSKKRYEGWSKDLKEHTAKVDDLVDASSVEMKIKFTVTKVRQKVF